jgi:DNA repair protein RecN (Recombination protein N)
MLTELRIKNFALIERLSLTFGPGFNVLTGETGAGKSILVGAINLVLGGRASNDLIRHGADEAEVEALFVMDSSTTANGRLMELGLPEGDDVLIRRVMPRNGRNRVYINGALATLNQLAALGKDLVALSGQHENQQLLDPNRQLLILDQFGGLSADREKLAAAHETLSNIRSDISHLKRRMEKLKADAELLDFQAREIREADLTSGEDDEWERERNLLKNVEKIHGLVRSGYERLYGQAGSIVEGLDQTRSELSRAVHMDHSLRETLDQIEDAYHQLDDAAATLRRRLDDLVFDPERLEVVEDRLALINKLKRKYGPTLDDVLAYESRAAGRLEQLDELEAQLAKAVDAEKAAVRALRDLADIMSQRRRDAAMELSTRVIEQVGPLGMPHVRFDVFFQPRSENTSPGPTGWDDVEFMIAPNKGEELKPLARIASGGELSRFMLALKSLLAGRDKVHTIILDEVDAGIGGAVAEVVGRRIHDLAKYHQLICITHLPQIAAFGRHHHRVFKEVRGERTVTGIDPLTEDEKTEEIARMLGGITPSATTLAAAEEMIARASG